MPFHAGPDRGSEGLAVCVSDAAGQPVAGPVAQPEAAGLANLLASLRRIAPAASLPVAIERPSGLSVDAHVEAGHPVFPIHPRLVRACRPRRRAASGRSDPGDAFMPADILRTFGHRFRALQPLSSEIRALRTLVRGQDDLVEQPIALATQPRALRDGFWPGAAAIFADLDSPIVLVFPRRYPTPDSAAHLKEKRLAGESKAEAKGERVRSLAILLAPLITHIEHHVADLPDGRIVMSFPRAGRLRAAQSRARPGDVRERFPTGGKPAAETGAAGFRRACSRHPHATRILARAWARVLRTARHGRQTYGPTRHDAAAGFATWCFER